jgi:hypothetical protein
MEHHSAISTPGRWRATVSGHHSVPLGGRSTEPSPPELIARFSSILDRFPEADRRKMFGFPAAFVGGNLATGLYNDGWMVRLGPDETARVIADGGGRPFEPMPGRPMSGYVLLPPGEVSNDAAIEAWVRRALAYAATLPPKG